MTFLVLFLIASYLLGSIPTSVWMGKIFYGIDIRQHGSGNAGATNTFRVLGAKVAIPVFIFDVFKGFIPPFLTQYYAHLLPQLNDVYLWSIIVGVFAVFKGGKGVATLLGMTLGIATIPALCSFGIFILVFIISRYVSLGSLIAGISFPLFVLLFDNYSTSLLIFSIAGSLLLFYTHRTNIKRLLNGTENKITLKKN